ncbi:SDR family NAD(P)-dependent oxidoreductase [Aneurinibacillus sp. REN35]|uniref:SDR family NAD(P)-dependent oxidoreductase n=1 Tax=Aneurinibacillus sp. REN35 TaxID=3237286 RepID=UPI0035288E57
MILSFIACDTTFKELGTVDILVVNDAGIIDKFVSAADLTDKLLERVFAINTTGSMRTSRGIIPIFTAKKVS